MNNRIKYSILPARLRARWTYNDYLYYRMQEMRPSEVELFMTPQELSQAEAALNADAFRPVFNSKTLFNKHFGQFQKREIVPFRSMPGRDAFLSMLHKHRRLVLKPDDMYAGLGIYIVSDNGNAYGNLPDTNSPDILPKQKGHPELPPECPFKDFTDFVNANYIAEEYVEQAPEYSSVYPGCLNTVRVTTLLDKASKPEILFIANQFGSQGSVVDNADDTAIWSITDPKTGKITDVDIDSKTGHIYDHHPDTGFPFQSFVNPHFDEILALALEAATIIPECRLVGWDIAVDARGEVLLIEGNVTPELDLYQMISGKGLRNRLNTLTVP